ncbi:hypothetical protein N0V93_009105 [Gnomoniopsis smithogilvyi]|uniref:PH domain-containing protein n=1 Tax=Gnomoniopsis smithogilvyi TaxID=1191159 RepID=A0A9W8YMH8_9PEZI|nr:hypothetical protein N0V93_009105 [Gnomoniopsis smithogilvyi]
MASDKPSLVIGQENAPDPFVTSDSQTHRFAAFDSDTFALGPGASPTSAKRALEAHLADTERRMAEAGKLGTALVQQRQELADRLKEVEQLEAEDELSPDLKQKLTVIEKDFNEVARESARAFLPKSRVPSSEVNTVLPFTPSKDAVRRSISPSKFEKFESMATGSPSKFSVPNRKSRNQPANRIHDIEFAAEISTSLITQVRNLQGLLQEREIELKDVKSEKSGLEQEVQGFQQRMRNLDESESRYKDENWNLETQIQELIAGQKEAADREKKLSHSLNALQADKNATQRELDEIKSAHTKLAEEHAAAIKHHDIELGTAKRNAVMAEGERAAMQRKIDELTSQNQELAKAIAVERGRTSQRNTPSGSSEDDLENAGGNATPEHSPPPSPIKPTPRHSMLETETIKTSLQHAQRTIQSLRTNVHREKTEKLELKRMLQDARDEIEKLRSDPVERPHQKRAREAKSREFKKPANRDKLGTARAVKAEILEDPEWEELTTVRGSPLMLARMAADIPIPSTEADDFDTANEALDSTDAYATARERGTETEDFQTGLEDFDSEDTETESPAKRAGANRAHAQQRRAPIFASSSQTYSYESTASTSGSEDEDYMDTTITRTPTSQPQKVRNRISRGSLSRRSRQFSEEGGYQRSPASQLSGSFSSAHTLPQQSLFAELGELEGSDEDSTIQTPGVRSLRSMTPASTARGSIVSPRGLLPAMPTMPKVAMMDSGMMTEPVDEQNLTVSNVYSEEVEPIAEPEPEPVMPPRLGLSIVFSEHVEPVAEPEVLPPPLSMSRVVAEFVEPVAEPEALPPLPPALSVSAIFAEHVEPVAEPEKLVPVLALSSIASVDSEPISTPEPEPKVVRVVEYVEAPKPPLPELSQSSIFSSEIEPVAVPEPEPRVVRMVEYVDAPKPPAAELAMSGISSAEIEPVPEPAREPLIERVVERVIEYVEAPKPAPPELAFSPVTSAEVEPIAQPEPQPKVVRVIEYMEAPSPPAPELTFSSLASEGVEPVAELMPLPATLKMSAISVEDVAPVPEPEVPLPTLAVSSITSEHIEPKADSLVLPPTLSVSAILSENVQPVAEELAPASLRFSTIESRETHPIEPESPIFGHHPSLPPLGFSSIESLDTEPISPRSPKRNAFIIPREEEDRPATPVTRGIFGSTSPRRKKESETIVIAEDETRQSFNSSPLTETPESQRPFKEISANSEVKPARKAPVQMSDSGAQTALTAEAIDQMFHAKDKQLLAVGHHRSDSMVSASDMGTPGTVRVRRSDESLKSPTRSKGKMVDAGVENAAEIALRRPGSATSTHASLKNAPPLPPNHKEVIEAARTGTANSGHGTIGSMPPPLFPASAFKNPMNRPRTPMSSASAKGDLALRPETLGTADVQSPTRYGARSRKSSVSSFASEVDHRFNIQNGMGMGMEAGFGPNTDPRMIQAITQTMIGEYLWKYTRKTGRGEMSEKRHRRYFWVHPYTRTLYWSDRDPTSAGRSELRAKSVPIEAVRVVTDDNPMPPGLHRKSLIIIAPGRSVKFTCTTGQRHETWFNALSYLLLRTNDEGQQDTEDMVNGITRDDVDEFNPSFGRQTTGGTGARGGAPSISSYNSRATRNEASSVNLDVPTLTPNHKKAVSTSSAQRPSLAGRLSGYWKSTHDTLSLRSRSGLKDQYSMYSNNDVHDSAEELRIMYERQDREADRLDNVRACCDGKHDVGTLTAKKRPHGPHSHSHTTIHGHPSRSGTPAPSMAPSVGTVGSKA